MRPAHRPAPAAAPGGVAPGGGAAGGGAAGGGDGGNDARWREAARLRAERRGWIIVWLAPQNCFRAYRRLPGARRDTALSAATAAEMDALIGQAEQAAAGSARGRGAS
jgi:hypothetical protein